MDKLLVKNLRKSVRLISLLGFFVAFLSNCGSEFDLGVLDLDPNHVVDYIAFGKENKLAPGTREYALLSSGQGSAEITRQLENIMQESARQISAMEAIGQKFDSTNLADHKQWIKELREKFESPIIALIKNATKDFKSAYDFGRKMDTEMRQGSNFYKHLSFWQGKLQSIDPQAAKVFRKHKENLINLYQQLYQQSVILAQAVPQEAAMKEISIIEKVLQDMRSNIEKDPDLVPQTQRSSAKASLRAATEPLIGTQKEIALMTRDKLKVQFSIKNSLIKLGDALNIVQTDYVNRIKMTGKTEALTQAKKQLADAKAALFKLHAINNNYLGNEKLKEPTSPELQNLLKRAFSGSMAFSTPSALELNLSTNDLVKIIDLLKTTNILALKRAEDSAELMKALGLAVDKKLAEHQGLKISGVIGLNEDSLNKIRTDFAMQDHDFDSYVKTRAQKVYDTYSSEAKHPTIFVIFADEFSNGVDVKNIIKIFAQKSHKVIVIADRPEIYSPVRYVTEGLDLGSGYYVARAELKALAPTMNNVDLIIVPLVKIFYGLSRSGQMNLVSLPLALKDTLLRIQQKPGSEIEAIKAALESMKDPIPTYMVKQSGILTDSLTTIEANMKNDRAYYRGRGY